VPKGTGEDECWARKLRSVGAAGHRRESESVEVATFFFFLKTANRRPLSRGRDVLAFPAAKKSAAVKRCRSDVITSATLVSIGVG